MSVPGRFACFTVSSIDIKNISWNYHCTLTYLSIYIAVLNRLIKFVMKPMTFHVFNINVVFFRYNTKKRCCQTLPNSHLHILPIGFFSQRLFWHLMYCHYEGTASNNNSFTFYTGAETFISNTLVTTKINLRLFYNVLGT